MAKPLDLSLGYNKLKNTDLSMSQQKIDTTLGYKGAAKEPIQSNEGFERIKPQSNRSWLESAISGLDYLANINRSAIRGALIDKESAISNAMDAATHKLYTSPTQLKDIVTKKVGLKKTVRFGEDDGRFQWGDVADFVADVGLDVATDPLTWVTFGLSSAAKGGIAKSIPVLAKMGDMITAEKVVKETKGGAQALKLTDTALDAIQEVKVAKDVKNKALLIRSIVRETGRPAAEKVVAKRTYAETVEGLAKKTKDITSISKKPIHQSVMTALKELPVDTIKLAKTWQKANAVIKPSLGAMYGYSASEPETEWYKKMINAGFGAAVVYGGSKAVKALKPAIFGGLDVETGKEMTGAFNYLSDYYYKYTRGLGVPLPAWKAQKLAEEHAASVLKNKVYKGADGEIARAADFDRLVDTFKSDIVYTTSFTSALKAARTGTTKKQHIALEIIQGRLKSVKGLSPEKVITMSEVIHDIKSETLLGRNRLLKKWGVSVNQNQVMKLKPGVAEEVDKIKGMTNIDGIEKNKQIKELIETSDPEYIRGVEGTNLINKATKEAEVELEKEFIPNLLKKQEKDVREAIDKFVTAQREVWLKYKKATLSGAEGLKYHIDTVYSPNDYYEVQELVDSFTPEKAMVHFAKGGGNIETAAHKVLGYDESFKIYADRMAGKFLDKKEREGLRILSQIRSIPANQAFFRGAEKVIGVFDKFNHFMKANLLQFSATWLKNNYFDNLLKAHVEMGTITALKTAAFGFNKDILADLLSLSSKGSKRIFHEKELMDGLKHGVLENPMFAILKDLDGDAAKYILNPTKFAERFKDKAGLEKLLETMKKAPDKWMEFLGGTTGRIGTLMESTARMTTYKDTLMSLRKSDVITKMRAAMIDEAKAITDVVKSKKAIAGVNEALEEKIKKIAAGITQKTFFDYGNITHLEQATLKRLIPFYAFYSKNLPYWVDTAFRIEKLGRFADIDRLRKNMGREPTEAERMGMGTYLSENAPRYTGYGNKGKKYNILPYIAAYDATNMFNIRTAIKDIQSKLNPIIKTPLELSLDRDWFSGGYMYPSSIRSMVEKRMGKEGSKYLFSCGHKFMAVKDMLDKIPFGDGVSKALGMDGVKLDAKGNPIATSDWFVGLDKAFSTLFPMGLVDQAAGIAGKTGKGEGTIWENILKQLSPIKQVEVPIKQEMYLRKQREGSRKPID